MEKIPFIKMSASGNDFIIIDNRSGNFRIYEKIIQKISDRKAWGCDQFIVLENSQKADIFMRIFNADGSEAGACGNATRCVASLIIKEQKKEKITIETISTVLLCWKDGDMISVNMGQPSFNIDSNKIPLEDLYRILKEEDFNFCNIGNPHLVFLDKILIEYEYKNNLLDFDFFYDSPLAKTINSPIMNTDYFEYLSNTVIGLFETNIEYIYPVNKNHIKVRVWERGVGETDCCGTGACAAVVVSAKKGLVKRNEKIQAEFKGGSLWINWQDDGDIIMTGDFEYIGTGEYDYKNSTAWW